MHKIDKFYNLIIKPLFPTFGKNPKIMKNQSRRYGLKIIHLGLKKKKYWIPNSFLFAETVPMYYNTYVYRFIDKNFRKKILMYVKNLATHHTNGGSDESAPIIMDLKESKLLMNIYYCHVISYVMIWILYIAINNFMKP